MSFAKAFTRTLVGVDAVPVSVEVQLIGGLPTTHIVGLAETAVKESRDRVSAAIQNSRFKYPRKRVVINLAPADLPKQGARFDLPIALGVLAATDQIDPARLARIECVGELGLSGQLRGVPGVLPVALALEGTDRVLIVPLENADEAALSSHKTIFAATTLLEVCEFLLGHYLLNVATRKESFPTVRSAPDMQDVKGQHQVKRAAEIAAAGGHNLLLSGPPGTGKSMVASRIPGILPQMTSRESAETASITSVGSGGFNADQWACRPFRSPHHTASGVALVGGGSPPKPGEISLAHHGVLFLDELPEFNRSVLDVLREPMETGCITISRAGWQSIFPARFQIVSAMNPCPCGYHGDEEIECRCTPDQLQRYQSKISGPFLDRMDMLVHVPRVRYKEVRRQSADGESSEVIRSRVEHCRQRQVARQDKSNALLTGKETDAHCAMSAKDLDLFDDISEKMTLSLRSHIRILRVARTIADLDASDGIETAHLMEAVSFRNGRLVF